MSGKGLLTEETMCILGEMEALLMEAQNGKRKAG